MTVMRLASLAALAAAAAITVAACGGSTEETAATPAATESAAVAESAMPEEAPAEETAAPALGTVVDVASGTEGFSTLVSALTAGELVDTLNGAGPFTVFAPTDDAFAALPAGVLDALLLPENKGTLVQILTYHVVPGTVLAADIADGEVATVEGQNVTLSTADGVTVNGAKVIQADVMADNGVIHVIDAVILPPGVDPAALITQ